MSHVQKHHEQISVLKNPFSTHGDFLSKNKTWESDSMRKLAVVIVLGALATAGWSQHHERDMETAAASGEVRSVSGGTTFEVAAPYDAVFDALVNNLKRSGLTLDAASRDAGQIATALEITGGWKQTGKRTVIALLKDSPTQTSVRIAVTIQKRYKGLQTEPWGDPKVDENASADTAAKIKADLIIALGAK